MANKFDEECSKLYDNTKKEIQQMLNDYQSDIIENDFKRNSVRADKIAGKTMTALSIERYRKSGLGVKKKILVKKINLIDKKISSMETNHNWQLFELAKKYNKHHSEIDK